MHLTYAELTAAHVQAVVHLDAEQVKQLRELLIAEAEFPLELSPNTSRVGLERMRQVPHQKLLAICHDDEQRALFAKFFGIRKPQ